MKIISILAWILVIVGGLNWGFVGAFNFNLVSTIFGEGFLTNLVYVFVGIAAAYMIFLPPKKN